MALLNRVLRMGEGRRLKTLEQAARDVNALEPEIEPLTDDELRERYDALRQEVARRLAEDEDVDRVLPDYQAEAFALVREAGRRALGMRHFDVQIMGGFTLADGLIAE